MTPKPACVNDKQTPESCFTASPFHVCGCHGRVPRKGATGMMCSPLSLTHWAAEEAEWRLKIAEGGTGVTRKVNKYGSKKGA